MIQTIINNFKNYMKIHKLSQGKAAEQIDISRTHLNKILNDKAKPSVELLVRMEKVMNGEEVK